MDGDDHDPHRRASLKLTIVTAGLARDFTLRARAPEGFGRWLATLRAVLVEQKRDKASGDAIRRSGSGLPLVPSLFAIGSRLTGSDNISQLTLWASALSLEVVLENGLPWGVETVLVRPPLRRWLRPREKDELRVRLESGARRRKFCGAIPPRNSLRSTARRPRTRPPLAGASACVPLATTLGAKFSGDLVVALSAPPPSAAAPPLHTHVRLSWRVAPAKGTRSAAPAPQAPASPIGGGERRACSRARRRSLGGLSPTASSTSSASARCVLLAARALSFDVPGSDLLSPISRACCSPANSTSGLDSLLPPLSPPLLLLLLPLALLAVAWYVIGFVELRPPGSSRRARH